MMHLKTMAWAAGVAILATANAWAQDKPFAGVELKMLGIGDTSVTRVAPLVGEFEALTGD
jgi:multiple sugar transport system substrate-binding protein